MPVQVTSVFTCLVTRWQVFTIWAQVNDVNAVAVADAFSNIKFWPIGLSVGASAPHEIVFRSGILLELPGDPSRYLLYSLLYHCSNNQQYHLYARNVIQRHLRYLFPEEIRGNIHPPWFCPTLSSNWSWIWTRVKWRNSEHFCWSQIPDDLLPIFYKSSYSFCSEKRAACCVRREIGPAIEKSVLSSVLVQHDHRIFAASST